MNGKTGPFRKVRIVTEDDTTPLPALIGEPFERLVAQERQTWEAHQAPRWWQAHVDTHEAPRAYWQAEDIRPKPLRLLWSLLWTGIVITLYVITVTFLRSKAPDAAISVLFALAVVTVARAFGGVEKEHTDKLDAQGMTGYPTIQRFSLRRAFHYVLLPPVSLYLCAKEAVAWILWRRAGRVWTAEDWNEERVAKRIFERFEKDVISEHKIAQLAMEAAAVHNRTASEEAARRAEEARQHSVKCLTSQVTLSKHYDVTHRSEQTRSKRLAQRARELEMLSTETGEQLELLRSLMAQYMELQDSQRTLRLTDSLAADDTADLELRTQMRVAHQAILAQRKKMETLLQPRPTATPEEEAAAAEQATPTAARTATGPHS